MILSLLFQTLGTFKKEELDLYKRFLDSNECISSDNLPGWWHLYKSNSGKSGCDIAKTIGMMFPGRTFVGIAGYGNYNQEYDLVVFKDDQYHVIFHGIQRLSQAVFALNIFDPNNDGYSYPDDPCPF